MRTVSYPSNLAPNTRHPFDIKSTPLYQKKLRLLKLMLRVKESIKNAPPSRVKGQPKPPVPVRSVGSPVHLPQPEAVRPVVTS